jgi:hypothetical protein
LACLASACSSAGSCFRLSDLFFSVFFNRRFVIFALIYRKKIREKVMVYYVCYVWKSYTEKL